MLMIKQPSLFNFHQCLIYLQRSDQELLHKVEENQMYKAVNVNGSIILFRLSEAGENLKVEFLNGSPSPENKQFIRKYIEQIFDLNRNIKPFYEQVQTDSILKDLINKYSGYRVIGIPDLFESLTWAIIGQQINLTFAYTLKKRFVQHFGEKVVWHGHEFWVFPEYERIAQLIETDLFELQFSRRKAEYIIGVAKLLQAGVLCQEELQELDIDSLEQRLLNIRGVGEWTAHYVMMRTFNIPSAFPVADVGLHRALEKQSEANKRPTIPEIKQLAENWEGWEAYATFYLWRSLYD